MIRRTAAIVSCLLLPLLAWAEGPVDFGLAELHKVIEDRGLNPNSFNVTVEYSPTLAADGFQIQSLTIRGGSRRGVMYGLLEAAEQLREHNGLVSVTATPRVPIRAARLRGSDEILARPEREWRALFATLARARFNRLRLELPALTAGRSARLAAIALLAENHAVDLALSLDEVDAPLLLKTLGQSIAFKGVETSAAPAAAALTALSEAGRYVTLDLAADALTPDLKNQAAELHVPLLGLSKNASAVAPYLWLAAPAAPESLDALVTHEASGFEIGPLAENWERIDRQLDGWPALAFTEVRGRAVSPKRSAKKTKPAKSKSKKTVEN